MAAITLAVVAADASARTLPPPAPDLVVDSLSAPPAFAVPGDGFVVADAVRNGGGRKAGASTARYSLVPFGGDTAPAGGKPGADRLLRLAERDVPVLPAGATSADDVRLVLPAGLADGAYDLQACADVEEAVDEQAEDNNCRTASRPLVVDTTPPPPPVIVGHPDQLTAETGARFTFSDAETAVTFACRVDDEAFAPCAGAVERTGLAEGAHRFEVTARDAAGNESAATSFDWTVDVTAPPIPEIGDRPVAVTTLNDAGFSFTNDESEVTFECVLDGAEPEACESPRLHTGLEDGEHVFTVAARDAAGNRSAAARVEWTIVPDELTMGDGAWSWFADPRAIRYKQRTYVGWVARDGDVKVSAFDHGLRSRETVLIAPRLEVDDHANPALHVLPDGRLRVYYSAHGGPQLWYRTSLAPEDVSAWEAPRSLPANTAGTPNRGYTYPNPVRLPAEQATFLFWRGGNYLPAFSIQADGSDGWTPPRTLITAPTNQRPYVKYASNGSDTIGIAFTNAHPREAGDVNIYYAAYRDGALRKADGTPVGTLAAPLSPTAADKVYDTARKAWVHDVAFGPDGNPVIVFAAFVSETDHRYMYARWTGSGWEGPHEITPAGGTFNHGQVNEYYYSGGITLDHEDPSVVYLSRQADDAGKVFEVETWRTPDGGKSWPQADRRAVTAGSTVVNVRPVSPRGLDDFSDDLSVIWMRGVYNTYLDYQTSMTTTLLSGGNAPPVADVTATPPAGPVPQPVALDATSSHDPDGNIVRYDWDFGDGARADDAGPQVAHTYRQPGRYFPTLTVVDDQGATDRFIAEVSASAAVPADIWTGPATELDAGAATLRGTVNPHNQQTAYHFEYGTTTAYGSSTPDEEIPEGRNTDLAAQTQLTGLAPGTYHYRLVSVNPLGTVRGDDRAFRVPPSDDSAYRDAILAAGPEGYWRLGEVAGLEARDETGAHPGAYAAGGVRLGEVGALSGDLDYAAGFDGARGEMSVTAPVPTAELTIEGWFDWRAGVALMRDDNSVANQGWILAFNRNGTLAWRAAGREFSTGRPVASLQGAWHHVALTMHADGVVALYLDGQRVQTGAVTVPLTAEQRPEMPWHVMRNGDSTTQFTRGRADEIAVYPMGLSAAEIAEHFAIATTGGG